MLTICGNLPFSCLAIVSSSSHGDICTKWFCPSSTVDSSHVSTIRRSRRITRQESSRYIKIRTRDRLDGTCGSTWELRRCRSDAITHLVLFFPLVDSWLILLLTKVVLGFFHVYYSKNQIQLHLTKFFFPLGRDSWPKPEEIRGARDLLEGPALTSAPLEDRKMTSSSDSSCQLAGNNDVVDSINHAEKLSSQS